MAGVEVSMIGGDWVVGPGDKAGKLASSSGGGSGGGGFDLVGGREECGARPSG